MICKNCGETISINFCSRCGQHKKVDRISLPTIWDDFSNNFLGFNSGFLYTIKSLLKAPGHSIRNYIEGHRKNFMKPVQFYILLLTIYFIINNLVGIDFYKIQTEFQADNMPNEKMKETLDRMNSFIYSNFKVIISLSIPFLALAMKILYRKSGYNYIELLVFSLYVGSIVYLISEAFTIFYLATNSLDFHLVLTSIASFIFVMIAITQFFEKRSFFSYLKAFIAYLFSQVLFMLFMIVLIVFLLFIFDINS